MLSQFDTFPKIFVVQGIFGNINILNIIMYLMVANCMQY